MQLALTVLLTSLITATPAAAKVITEVIPYTQNGTALKGFLAYDDEVTGKRPGILVVH